MLELWKDFCNIWFSSPTLSSLSLENSRNTADNWQFPPGVATVRLTLFGSKAYHMLGHSPACVLKNLKNPSLQSGSLFSVPGHLLLHTDEVNEFSSVYPILPAALGPGVCSSSNRNEYQKQKNNVCGK
jgi:hypothetical protein